MARTRSKWARRLGWTVAILLVAVLAGALALFVAVQRNGPAVLDAVDRLTGTDRKVALVEKARFGESPAQKIAVYRSQETEGPLPVVLFMHGGSWNKGDPDDYGFIARALAPEGFVVVLAGYRLHPDSAFPGMLEDTAAAIAWTASNVAEHGGRPDHIVLAGHSAGAYNVVMTSLDRQWLGRLGQSGEAIAGVVGLAGPYDFYPFDSDSTRASFGEAPRPAETQPVTYARGDAPPMLLMTGEADTTVKPRNTRALATRLDEEGGRFATRFFPDKDHTDILLALASPWRRDREVLDAFVAFAREPGSLGTPSVPVQGETR